MQDKKIEKAFYERMFSNLKGADDGHCITYGYDDLIQKHLGVLPPSRLLDVGCGTGKNSVRLAKAGFDVIGIELSSAGIDAARKHAQKEGQKVLFVQGDVENMPFKDNVFEISFCGLILHHFPRIDALIQGLSRVTQSRLFALEVNALEPQSFVKFNIINACFGHPAISRNQRALFPKGVSRELLRHGFEEVEIEYIDIHSPGMEAGIKGWLRRSYLKIIRFFPLRFRSNKFFICVKK